MRIIDKFLKLWEIELFFLRNECGVGREGFGIEFYGIRIFRGWCREWYVREWRGKFYEVIEEFREDSVLGKRKKLRV